MILIGKYKVSEVICLKCFQRWKAARPIETKLCQLECTNCRLVGYAIETGETSITEELIEECMGEKWET